MKDRQNNKNQHPDMPKGAETAALELEYDLDENPEKVWRAITRPEYRQSWLPDADLAEQEALSVIPGREVRYRMRENTPPFQTSDVTIRITPNPTGGTHLRVIHEVPAEKAAANTNTPALMCAA